MTPFSDESQRRVEDLEHQAVEKHGQHKTFTYHTNEVLAQRGLLFREDRNTGKFRLVDATTVKIVTGKRQQECIAEINRIWGSSDRLFEIWQSADLPRKAGEDE